MTKDEHAMIQFTVPRVFAARVEIAKAMEMILEAAEACKGNPMRDRLYSLYDDLSDMKHSMKTETLEWKKQLMNGTKVPESWKEAI